MSPRILIIGGGVGGLALAQGLHRQGVAFTVFERDAFLDSRRQGYRLKISGDLQAKLRDLLTDVAWDEIEATGAASHLGETTLNATDAAVLACRRGRPPAGAPKPLTLDRGLLRRCLMRGIEHCVVFGKQFDRYELCEESVIAHFKDGSSEAGSFLVGADGSNSNVRRQYLPDLNPTLTDTYCIYGKSELTDELQARFPPHHRRWITVVRDQTPALQSIIWGESPVVLVSEACHFNRSAQGVPPDYVHWGLLFTKDAVGHTEFELNEALTNAAALSLDLTQDWHPSVRSLIELQDPATISGMRIMQASQCIATWKPSAQLTLLGDAVHVMSPAGGVGAMAALNDVVILAGIIGANPNSISADSIGSYEEAMRQFAKVCIQRTQLAGAKLLNLQEM